MSTRSLVASQPATSERRKRREGLPFFVHFLVWAYVVVLVAPLYFLLVSGLKSNVEIFSDPWGLPQDWLFSNFADAWKRASLGQGLLNSAIVTIGASALALLLAIPASYALARAQGRIGMIVERFFALGLLIPAFAALVPTLLASIALGLFHTREFLIAFLTASSLPLAVILLTQFMRAVPKELEESAMMDGAGRLVILWQIYVPSVIPGISMVAILNFLAFWNEYLFSLVLLGAGTEDRTVQVAIPNLVSQTNTQFGILLAGCLITMVPVYALYIVLQRQFERALLSGAVKG
jgi:multiple sugar transport system permease protein